LPDDSRAYCRGLFSPSLVVAVGGRRVGVVGYLTPETLGTYTNIHKYFPVPGTSSNNLWKSDPSFKKILLHIEQQSIVAKLELHHFSVAENRNTMQSSGCNDSVSDSYVGHDTIFVSLKICHDRIE
jgi:hypothetical protein